MSGAQATAIIAAAGQGERLADSTNGQPKQFSDLCGVPLFVWSTTTLIEHPAIKDVLLVVPAEWQERVNKLVLQHLNKFAERIRVIPGGNTRQESVSSALEKLALNNNSPSYILIHDAARPFVTAGDIDRIINKLQQGFAATLGVSLSDSIKRVKDNIIVEDLNRSEMVLMQTPQAADFKLILEAHRHAKQKKLVTTDDASIVKSYGVDVTVVPGSRFNLKITEADDILIARALVESHAWLPGKVSG